MGLDMYLKRNYPTRDKTVTIDGVVMAGVNWVATEVAYWRKANQIHNWFVENVQHGEDNCGTYDVSNDDLINLVKLCKEVLASRDPSIANPTEDANFVKTAEELLPTTSGFFFGSTEYDDGYEEDLELTIEKLEPLISPDDTGDYPFYEYSSSW